MAGTSKDTEDAGDQTLTLTTPKQTHSLCKQAVYNKLYTDNDGEETDIDTGMVTNLKTKPKVSFEVIDSTDTKQNEKVEEDENIPLEKFNEIDKSQDKRVFSDPYITYQTSAIKSSKEVIPVEKDQKAKLIFFDELVRPYQRLEKNDFEIPKYSLDSLIEPSLFKHKNIDGDDVYTKMRSSPEICLDQMAAATDNLSKDDAGLISNDDESDTDTEQKSVIEDKAMSSTENVAENQTSSSDAAEIPQKVIHLVYL